MNWNTSSTADGYFNASSFSGKNKTGAASNSQTQETSRGTAQNLVPIAIEMIPETGLEDGLKLYGFPVYMVKIVGSLLEYEIQTTQAKFKVRDPTGSIKAYFLLDNTNTSSGPSNNLSTLKEGCLVEILGKVGVKDGERSVMVVDIKPVDDANSKLLATHLYEVIRTKLRMKSLRRETTTNAGGLKLTYLQSKIAKFLKNDSEEVGVDLETILTHFPVPRMEEVEDALKFLLQEGLAYTTIDTDHFKSTD